MIAPVTAIYIVAALDDGRFHWLPLPWWLCGIGYLMFLVGMGLATWVGAVNQFAEGPVRIQTERGHTVIDTGPYAIVRPPGLFGRCFPLWGHRPVSWFFVGALSRWSLHGVGDSPHATGGSDVAGRAGRVQGVHGKGAI